MGIKITVDEAEAFDRLSILQIKIKNTNRLKSINNQANNLIMEIMDSISYEKYKKIMTSPEYENLYQSNKKIFDLVDEIKKQNINALIVDTANHERFKYKKALQDKFFKNPIQEIKLGYE